MTDRQTGVAICAGCGYQARLTDDEAADVRDTLRRILLAHLLEYHPEERVTDTVRDLLHYTTNGGAYG